MKKYLYLGILLASSLSFNAQAEVLSDIEGVYLDVQNWFVQVIKPGKPDW